MCAVSAQAFCSFPYSYCIKVRSQWDQGWDVNLRQNESVACILSPNNSNSTGHHHLCTGKSLPSGLYHSSETLDRSLHSQSLYFFICNNSQCLLKSVPSEAWLLIVDYHIKGDARLPSLEGYYEDWMWRDWDRNQASSRSPLTSLTFASDPPLYPLPGYQFPF